jgi:periplasmic copper chaperone A
MKKTALLLVILASLVGTAKAGEATDLMIVNVELPASLVPTATSGVLYFTVMNHGAVDDELISVATPRAKSAMLHENRMEGDVMKMEMLMSIDIPPGGTVTLDKGGRHVMLTGLDAPLKDGEVVPVELTFENAGVVRIDAVVTKSLK